MNITGIHMAIFNAKPDGVFYIGNHQGTAAGIRPVIDAPEIRVYIIPVPEYCFRSQRIFLVIISTPGMQGNN